MKLLVSFFIVSFISNQILANEMNQEFAYPGGVYVKKISVDQFQNGFYYLDMRVPTVKKGNNYYLLFGIPRDIDLTTKKIILKNGNNDYVITLHLKEKYFGKQNITTSKKFTEPNDTVIDRIIKEKNILNLARNKWTSNDIDTNFILSLIHI